MHTPAVLAATLLLSSASVLGKLYFTARNVVWPVLIAAAHPGDHAYPDSGLLAKRAEKTARCANAVGAMKQKRHQMRKREQAAQELAKRENVTTFAIHAEAPHYDFIKNDTCILYPETTQGPYWYPPSQLLTQDMAQDQAGVPFELDIGVIDMATCEPLENALISLWVSWTRSMGDLSNGQLTSIIALQCHRFILILHGTRPKHTLPNSPRTAWHYRPLELH